MNREAFDDSVATRHSKVWDALKSRHSCIHEPLPARSDHNRRYLTSLMVFGDREVKESQSPLPDSFYKLMTDQNIIEPQIIMDKITNVLRKLTFREPRVLVQFWSPVTIRKRCLLTTLDQPFGLGTVDEGLYLYRLESEQRMFVVDGEVREELGPPARVYRQKLPEWSLDAQDLVASYNIHGYICLPVFEPDSDCCVGVLELITSSKYVDYAFEVRQISKALKEENLWSPNAFEDTISYVEDEKRQHELDEIFVAMKMICDIQKLPIAQTWGLSRNTSYVEYSGNLVQSCSSFNKSCIGKVCMSTTGLPYYVRDLSMWGFHEACRSRHLEKSQGVVGRSFSSHGLCFCEDVSKLGEDEYPLVTYAYTNGITGCLGVYLKSLELDVEYVIELFLPPQADLRSLVKIVKQEIKNGSSIQLGVMLSPQVIGEIPLDWNLEWNLELDNLQLLANNGINDDNDDDDDDDDDDGDDGDFILSKAHSEVAYVEHMKQDNLENELCNSGTARTSQNVVDPYLEVEIKDFDNNNNNKEDMRIKYSDNFNGPSRKRTQSDQRSISLEEISKHFGKTMNEAANVLHVSRSTLKRICRSLGIRRWPYKNGPQQTNVTILASLDAINRNHDNTTLTQRGKHQSTEADTPIAENSIANNVMIKATYKNNIVKFPFSLSDGLVKLEELIATRFQLALGSFRLKYEDEDGDLILISCENDIIGLVDASRKPGVQTLIRLLLWSIVHQES